MNLIKCMCSVTRFTRGVATACLLLGIEYCVGCGEGIKNDRHRILLQSEVSQHVIPLLLHILELEGKGETNSGQLVRAGARMCRRCFSAYDRYTKQITLLRKSISKVLETLDNGSESDNCNAGDPPLPPPPKRLAISVGPSTASPDVMVGKHVN